MANIQIYGTFPSGGEGVVQSDTIKEIWSGTQAEYDALSETSDTTLYIIKE